MAKKFDFLSPGINIREIDQSFIPTERDAEGPIIIGRTRKGPANKPVKIRNLDDFVSIFGLPVAGGNGAMGDVWREGNTIGPTYASYAAQSWLASEQSAVTVVRIAGEQHSAVETGGEAGWQVAQNGAGIGSTGHNSTAYGLFIADASDASQATAIKLEAGAGGSAGDNFDPLYLESSGNVLSFHHKSTAFAGVNHSNATFTLAGGLLFELAFDVDNSKVAGSTTRAGMGGANSDTPKVTVVTHTTSAFEDVLSYIHSALVEELAHAEDAFSGSISLDYTANGDSSTLHVYNLSSANNLAIADEPGAGTFCPFQADAQDNSGGTANDVKLQTAGTGLAITAKATQGSTGDGALAAVIYSITGALALVGERLGTSGTTTTEAGALIKSDSGRLGFTLKVFDESGTEKETLGFNFDRNSNNYIRSKLNTNPQLANTETTIVAAEDHKTYWLGETFADHLHNFVAPGAVAGDAVGILLPLGTSTTTSTNWGYQRHGAREAKSGWVFSDRSTNQQKLLRFKSMHVGEEIQKNYLIAIEEITAPANPNVSGYGTFTVCIKDVAGNTVEKYSGCNLNPASPNYVAARIGDQYQEWSDTDKRYRTYGDFLNQSNIFYIEMSENVANGGGQGLIPAGFYGPVRAEGFRILAGDDSFKNLDGGDHANPSVQSARSGVLFKGQTANTDVADLSTAERIGFTFPKLRMRDNGSDGGASDQARTYWGIRPKISAASTQHDPDFIDYTRGLGMSLGENGTHVPATGFEYSFIFSLDDVSGSAGGSVWTWASGNFGSTVGAHPGDGVSFTSKAGKTFEDLLDENVRQFIMPVWGGSEGFDITEAEPLRNELITDTTLSEKTNYVDYSISKALDSVADPEVVPANLLVMPGIWRSSATNKMINIAESRKDILSIIDIQGDYRPRVELNSVASVRQGSVTTALTSLKARNLNSSFACTFYPAVQVSDNLNGGQLVWLPASIAGLGAIARSQATSELWFAPAGFNRGGLGSLGGPRGPRVLQARQRLDSKERDLLYERNINPIATFPAEGVVIFGQKTLQADASALDRINVRRLVLYLKSEVSAVARNLLFDQNVESTWNRFKAQVNPLLSDTKARFGLTDYKLILDDTTTTADLIDRNIMYAKIFIKPARAIEYIVVDFVITRTGADFV